MINNHDGKTYDEDDTQPGFCNFTPDGLITPLLLLDYGAVHFGTRYQLAGSEEVTRWTESTLSTEQLTTIMERWKEFDRILFEGNETRYEEESVYVNLMFRFDIITRLARWHGIPLSELFRSLFGFTSNHLEVIGSLTQKCGSQRENDLEGIHAYPVDTPYHVQQKSLLTSWKTFINQSNMQWKDVVVSECGKLLILLPKAVESLTRLDSVDRKRALRSRIFFKPRP
ncbi:MAG: hypothetical protein JXA25_13415 [Anaerolineales bacterium]|nr:hypothetical protein [Anaerolineales bacterium]